MGTFRMPSLGADMEAGTLAEWLIKPGDTVKRGDIVAVVETQKGAIEIEIFEDGTVGDLVAQIGQTVPVGAPLAMILGKGESVAAPLQPEQQVPPAEAPAVEPVPARTEEAASPPAGRPAVATGAFVRASPAARRLAQTRGIDLSGVTGSGPDGAIVLADIETRAARPSAAGGAEGMRAAIAAAMARSKREIPHYYLAHDVDLSRAARFLEDANAGKPAAGRMLLIALFVKAVARACGKYPEFNGHMGENGFSPAATVHAGVAINIRGGGLVAPAIHDAQDMTAAALMAAISDLVARVRAGRYRSGELADSTITVSSLGDRGVDRLFGVIYPPQVAIVGFGTPRLRPWAEGTTVDARLVTTITLSADHRVSDGHRGALFLARIGQLLQEPESL
ncbi:dihydrolipoamide acetyltransferase family protein [Zhengella sp. ZM62]|uniref:dihydrolipoamide acetyltransferase family protein n=1 Tax=Zhengella sedimenti TaxID=3390035 RepID=UPI003976F3F2